jgi:hypothetical protein
MEDDSSSSLSSARLRAEDKEQTLRQHIELVADLTQPDFSVLFLTAFGLVIYFNETSYFAYTYSAVACWIAIQLASYFVKEEHRNDLFWSILSLFGNVASYLFLGYGWSLIKLYLEIWQGNYAAELAQCANSSAFGAGVGAAGDCIFDFVLSQKWQIARWTLTWPVSLIATLSRDPLRVFTDCVFEWSKQRYVWIVTSALSAEGVGVSFLWILCGVLVYAIIGYAWTHAKLFIDVWQGTLPPRLDAEIRGIYAQKGSYWDIVTKMKYYVLQWMITWPVSLLYTIARHPMRMLGDLIYRLSQRKYMFIISRAMEARMKKE